MGARYIETKSGETFELRPLMHIRCCDCGLVHTVRVKRRGRTVLITATWNNRATAASRRAQSFKYRESSDHGAQRKR